MAKGLKGKNRGPYETLASGLMES